MSRSLNWPEDLGGGVTRHDQLLNVLIDQHHARDHQARHLVAGGDTFTHGAPEHTDISKTLFWEVSTESSPVIPYASFRFQNNLAVAAHVTRILPSDFVSVTSLYPVIHGANAAGNVYRNVRIDFCANGEAPSTHSTSSGFAAVALGNTVLLVEATNFSGYLAGATAADVIGLDYGRDSTNVLDTYETNVYFLGWLFTYLANQ